MTLPAAATEPAGWLRFSGEKTCHEGLAEALPSRELLESGDLPVLDHVRRVFLSTSLRLSEASAPQLHKAARLAMERLGRQIPCELFQVSGEENACAAPFQDHALIRLEGKLLALLDDGTRLALLGHELGHVFCHSTPGGIREGRLIRSILDGQIPAGTSSAGELRRRASLLSQARELTADRCGLLACRSLKDALKLQMMLTTGLSAASLDWDTDAYLLQCSECIEPLIADQSGVVSAGASHPLHVLRSWALALFWESDLFHRTTGLGPGTRPIAQVEETILKALERSVVPSGFFTEEAGSDLPQEVLLCALAACVIVAFADGEITEEEEDAIEGTFAGKVSAWRDYFDLKSAAQLLDQAAEAVMAMGEGALLSIFMLACHVMASDGRFERSEVAAILMVGRALGCEDLWFRMLVRMGIVRADSGSCEEEKSRLRSMAANVSLAERKAVLDALDAFLSSAAKLGGTRTTLRRLLALMGAQSAEKLPKLVPVMDKALRAKGLTASPDLASLADSGLSHLDMPVILTAESAPEQAEEALPSEPAKTLLKRALTSLQDSLVSGNGRSASVLAKPTKALMDLTDLDKLGTGRAERIRAVLSAGEGGEAELISPLEAASSPAAAQICRRLKDLARADKDQQEAYGSSDLCLGTAFAAGRMDAGHRFRAPLRLIPVELVRIEGGQAPGWKLRRRGAAMANIALVRAVRSRQKDASAAMSDEFLDELKDAAEQSEEALVFALATKGFFPKREDAAALAREERKNLLENAGAETGKEAPSPSSAQTSKAPEARPAAASALEDALRPMGDEPPCMTWMGRPSAEIEPCAALGIFPQSRSELLYDYGDLISEIDAGAKPVGELLSGAKELLPDELKDELHMGGGQSAPPPSSKDAAPESAVPAVSLDPSQREALRETLSSPAMVIDGPPGTGKSQVIVGIVLDALARGERVAVVSEKRAALDVVAQRLAANGFGGCYGLVHDVESDRKPLYARIAQRMQETPLAEPSPRPLREALDEAGRIEAELSCRHGLLNLAADSGGAALSMLAEQRSSLDSRPELSAKFPTDAWPADMAAISPRTLTACADQVARLRPFGDLMRADSPWAGLDDAAIPDAQELESLSGFMAQAQKAVRAQASDTASSEGSLAGRAARWLNAFRFAQGLRTPVPAGDLMADWNAVSADLDALAASPLLPALTIEGWDAVTPHVSQLLSLSGSFFRWLFPSFWKSRRAARAWLQHFWNQLSSAKLTPAFLENLLLCAASAEAFQKGLPRPAQQASGSAAAALLLGSQPTAAIVPAASDPLRQSLDDFWKARERLHLWLSASAPRHADGITPAGIGELKRIGEASAAFKKNFGPEEKGPAEDLDALTERVRTDRERLLEWRDRAAQTRERLAGGCAAARILAEAFPEGTDTAWHLGFYSGWNDLVRRRIQAREPKAADLTRPTPWGTCREAAERLAQLDAEATEQKRALTAASVSRRGILSLPKAAPNQRRTPEQRAAEDLLHEATKRSKLLTMRTFVRRFVDKGLMDVLPVWMLSPETMCTLFPRQPVFDLVVFDEASQSTMASGLPALLRTKKWVIAGDDKQMPPSAYFQQKSPAADEDDQASEESKAARELFDDESLLTLARRRVPHARLTWHYRCQDEALIAFSNHAFYGASLSTIPAPPEHDAGRLPALSWVRVEDPEYVDMQNRPEAVRVVDLIAEELLSGSGRSVGVVTFNIHQRATVLDVIDERRAADAAFKEAYDAAMAGPLDKRPFVKNLENVQGDERDIIIFSLGHAPEIRKSTGAPFVRPNFGPLNGRGGERRLNVAISRAKEKCLMVSSFEPELLSVAKTAGPGIRLLKLFLEYARSVSLGEAADARRCLEEARIMNGAAAGCGPQVLNVRRLPESIPLAVQIAVEAEKLGFSIEQNVGASGFSVPLALFGKGRRPLAVLIADGSEEGAPYDLDVHRPALLRRKGWDVVQVDPVTWAADRQAVIQRLQRGESEA